MTTIGSQPVAAQWMLAIFNRMIPDKAIVPANHASALLLLGLLQAFCNSGGQQFIINSTIIPDLDKT